MTSSASPSTRGSARTCSSAAVWTPGARSTTSASTSTLPAARRATSRAIYSAFGPAVQVPGAAITIDGQANCRVVTPFRGQTQVKVFGTYILPKDFVVSLILQNTSGQPVVAELRGAQRDHRAVARSRPVGPRPYRHGSADRPADGFEDRVYPARLEGGQTHTADSKSPPAGQCQLLQPAERRGGIGDEHDLRSAVARTLGDSGRPDGPVQRESHLLKHQTPGPAPSAGPGVVSSRPAVWGTKSRSRQDIGQLERRQEDGSTP